MKCPKCVEEGKRSKVYSEGTTSTCMMYDTYWDEDGKIHKHDPNAHTSIYSCSNGHEWSQSKILPCPSCDYGKDRTEINFFNEGE
jgi:hypothetical protein